MTNEYLFWQADIIVETDYKRITKGFAEKFREGLKGFYPKQKATIDKIYTADKIRFELQKIDEIEYNLKNKVESIKFSNGRNNPNGKKDFRKIFIYKEVN
jgi:hypothetical protein